MAQGILIRRRRNSGGIDKGQLSQNMDCAHTPRIQVTLDRALRRGESTATEMSEKGQLDERPGR
ncbi:hypothetical protein ColTof4_04326 [Colletotrichum tofieldiae]|nr:hypothetical protein ColTof3_11469 [Colletotrichum tofieldiae]GKT71903.1 hypothetical protein ColTof4_04326 [Colletotrichum tofieldiae]